MALSASIVETLIGLLGEERPPEVQREASTTLASACFDDMAKIIAIQVYTVAGRGEKSLLCDPGSELRVGRRERRRCAKIMNGMSKYIYIYI